ncbi:hypothetical protein BDK89_0208 [Ilumatobacter fluminis]|uniref:DUF6916 domain-containing protein n=1 Tax=Ilumatobacter fluminis TaxID=467091 RepID=A0A4R7HWW3_9ACTN|nr:hypothetical protein BDK89_0208 [Ilumatobacter fluminis]
MQQRNRGTGLDSGQPSHAQWAAAQGDVFTAADGMEVTLRRVSDPTPQGPFESYSLLFDIAATTEPTQGNLTLTHPTLGTVELFVVAIGSDDGGSTYEAIISARRDETADG